MKNPIPYLRYFRIAKQLNYTEEEILSQMKEWDIPCVDCEEKYKML